MADPAQRVDPVFYPPSDGAPLGETFRHIDALLDLMHQLRWHLRGREHERFVGGNQFWYYAEGDPTQVVCPDVYVVAGVPQDADREIWKTWEDGVVPQIVFELTSRKTRYRDLGEKRGLYEVLGVEELWLFDPLGDYLRPPVQGYLQGRAGFVPAAPFEGRWFSPALGLHLVPEGPLLGLVDASGERPPRFDRTRALIELARNEADRARLQVQLAHADADRARAEAEEARAEAEEARADARDALDRVAALEAELERLRRG